MNGTDKVDAFPTPSFFSMPSSGGGNFGIPDLSAIFPVIFAIVFFIWLVYTIVVTYHWLRYGHRSFLTVPLLAVHFVVSGTLMLLATAGLH